MRARHRSRLTLAVIVLTLGLCGGADAGGGTWVTLVGKLSRFRLTVPRSCYVVPDSVAKARALVTQLEQRKQARLAGVYTSIIDSTDVTRFAFEAFFYSPSAAIQPTVTLAVSRATAAETSAKGLGTIAKSSTADLRTQGASIVDSRVLTVPAGPAVFVEATQGTGAGKTLLEFYVIGHGALLYQLSFRTAAATRSGLATFATIVHRFAAT